MSHFANTVVLGFIACSALACSSARIVHDTRSGGTVALRGPRDSAREKADVLMQEKCPRGFAIVEQGEVTYGQEATSRQWTPNVQTTQVNDKHEWHIVFVCTDQKTAAMKLVVSY